MTPFAIAGIQMSISADTPNLETMRTKLELLLKRFPWVQMVVFSELAAFGPSLEQAQPLPGPAEHFFCELARANRIWLIPGSLFEKAHNKIYNTCPVINPKGEVIGRYRKLFPAKPYEYGIEAGNGFLIFDVPEAGRFGLSLSYDMWFQETTRSMVAQGVEVIIHPNLTDTIDRDIELSIARATAVSNQCYFIDINGVEEGGNGRSTIIGPAGNIIYEARGNDEFIPVEIDLERVRHERKSGILGLGQPLKSFRDRSVIFSLYQNTGHTFEYLENLGPLQIRKPKHTAEELEKHRNSPADGKSKKSNTMSGFKRYANERGLAKIAKIWGR